MYCTAWNEIFEVTELFIFEETDPGTSVNIPLGSFNLTEVDGERVQPGLM